MWVETADLPRSDGHPFFERLNRVLADSGFDAFVAAGLVKGKTVGVDATTLEANAAMRSIERSPRAATAAGECSHSRCTSD